MTEQPTRKGLRRALVDMRCATGPVGELAFWSKTVIVERTDRDAVCAALDRILREHPEWAQEES